MPYPKFWTPNKLGKLKSLYDSGLGMQEVANEFRTTLGSINHVMRRANIPRRKANITNHLRFMRSPKSFTAKINLTESEKQLKIADLMLYWAEGAKRNSKCVDLANSDAYMIKLFILRQKSKQVMMFYSF